MSSGRFEQSFYELNNGSVAKIAVQEETLLLSLGGSTNTAATGPADLPSSAVVSRGRRSKGINARLVRIQFTASPPVGYAENEVISLPWLRPSTFDALNPGATGTYLSTACRLVGKTGEAVR